MSNATNVLVTDFDGTMTRYDFYRLVVERFLTPEDITPWDEYRRGEITHFQALQKIFRKIHRPKAEVLDILRDMRLDPKLPQAVESLRRAGWDVVVSSAGCEWYVKRMLVEIGVDIPVHSNPGEYPENGPLEMREPKESQFYCPEIGINKAEIVRFYQQQGKTVAYAGDGYADTDAALIVPDDLRFARFDLAETLKKKGKTFHSFNAWSDIAAMLLTE